MRMSLLSGHSHCLAFGKPFFCPYWIELWAGKLISLVCGRNGVSHAFCDVHVANGNMVTDSVDGMDENGTILISTRLSVTV